jgi:hypothetical protein
MDEGKISHRQNNPSYRMGRSRKEGNIMKRIVFCLVSVGLLIGIYAHDSAAATATVTLSRMTQAYTGGPLKPTATTSPANLPIIWTNAPKTAAGSYTVTATIGSNPNNYTGSKSGTFTIYRPAGGFGGTSSGGGSDDNYWEFTSLPSESFLGLTTDKNLKLVSISVTATDPLHDPSRADYVFLPDECSGSPWDGSLPFTSPLECKILGNYAEGTFTWSSITLDNNFEAFFNFNLGLGIPVWDDIVVKVLFDAEGESLELVRTWAFDYERYIATNEVDKYYVETTLYPPPLEPQPDDLSVLSVNSYSKVREVRWLLGWWMYSYEMKVNNNGTAPLDNVCGMVRSSSSSVKIIDPEVCFPDIPAGGSATSKGTFTFMAKGFDASRLSWIYSSIKIAADPADPITETGTHPLSYYVTLSTSAPKNYYVLFHQWVPEGVTATPDAPLGWETSEATTWTVTQDVTVSAPMASEIKAGAWIINTLQGAEVTVPIQVPAP